MAENTSGTGGPVPEEIKGWNWGAFWLNWIWGIGNSVWIAFVVLVLGLIWQIYLGVKGNELAWQNRKFESVQQFKDTQAAWSKWDHQFRRGSPDCAPGGWLGDFRRGRQPIRQLLIAAGCSAKVSCLFRVGGCAPTRQPPPRICPTAAR